MRRLLMSHERGFTLMETLVALVIVVVAMAGLVPLFLQSTTLVLETRRAPTALAAAESKIEHLRALSFTYDASGHPRSDTSSDTALDPPTPTGGTGLRVSPTDSLTHDVTGFVDYLDQYGRSVRGRPEAGVFYTRRWAIALVGGDADLLEIQSCVWKSTADTGMADACVSSVRVRR
jgi:prepilin-type N-terminal cleavage/methylation domain-containing protein